MYAFAALNFMARKMFSYVACLASLLNCIIIYIFIYEHFFLANNKIYKLICDFWAIIVCPSNYRFSLPLWYLQTLHEYCYLIIIYLKLKQD
jgi:hypothetical protein